jgi:hypothetical protein
MRCCGALSCAMAMTLARHMPKPNPRTAEYPKTAAELPKPAVDIRTAR